MSEITNENFKRRRGRPKIDTGFLTGNYDSRRATVNKKYMYDATELLDIIGDEIPDSKLLYNTEQTKSRRPKSATIHKFI